MSLPSHIPQCKALYDFKMNKEDDEGCLSFSKVIYYTIIQFNCYITYFLYWFMVLYARKILTKPCFIFVITYLKKSFLGTVLKKLILKQLRNKA